jgi:hypothetical protein
MAKTRISATPAIAKESIADVRDAYWQSTNENANAFRRLSTQFFAIGQELGWRGAASDLAKLGQQSAQTMHALQSVRCNEIRDDAEADKK